MDLNVIITLLMKIVIISALGYALKRFRLIDQATLNGLANILLYGTLPAGIIASSSMTYSADMNHNLLFMIGYSAVYYAVFLPATMLLGRSLRLSRSEGTIMSTCCCFSNIAFLGMPVMLELFGQEGVFYAVAFNILNQLLVFTVCRHMYSGSGSYNIRAMLLQPVTIALAVMLLIYFSPFRLPSVLQSSLSALGDSSTTITLIIVGGSLSECRFRDFFRGRIPLLTSVIKLLIMPLAVLAAVKMIGLPYTLGASCVMIAALPSGTLNCIFAQEFSCDPELASITVMLTTLLMGVTLPLMLLLTGTLLA